jgi:hypothetical protein
VLGEIKQGILDQDCIRSGRLEITMQSHLIKLEPFLSDPMLSSFRMPRRQSGTLKNMSTETGQKVSATSSTEPEAEEREKCHITMDSSDSSEGEDQKLTPVVGHYLIDVPGDEKLWLNKNPRMFHLSGAEHVKVLRCGRRITAGFRQHHGEVRYDSAKCKACSGLKTAELQWSAKRGKI